MMLASLSQPPLRWLQGLLLLTLLIAALPAAPLIPATRAAVPEPPILLKDLNPGVAPLDAWPERLTVVGDRLMFFAADSIHGWGLWSSDGTPEGTRFVWGPPDSQERRSVQDATVAGDSLIFLFDDRIHGMELWRSDGTAQGTALLKEFRPGEASIDLGELGNLGQFVSTGTDAFFVTHDESGFWSLWTSDGTPEGTRSLLPLTPFTDIFSAPTISVATTGNRLFFRWLDQQNIPQLWVSDGTPTGTYLVKLLDNEPVIWMPGGLGAMNGTMFFSADDGVHGYELWRTDGTAQGTRLVADLDPGPGHSRPNELTAVGDRIYFITDIQNQGRQLWQSDGTSAGTALVPLMPGQPAFTARYGTPKLFPANGYLLVFEPGWNDYLQLWALHPDGSPLTPVHAFRRFRFLDSYFATSSIAVIGKRVLMLVYSDEDLWSTDGTAAGTQELLPDTSVTELTGFAGRVFLSARDVIYGQELWVSDGTPQASHLFKDLHWVLADAQARCPTEIGGRLFFSADDGTHGQELWISDGTPQGTWLLGDLAPGRAHANPCSFTQLGELVVFRTGNATTMNIWATDGTLAQTQLLLNVKAMIGGSQSLEFIQIGDELVFVADHWLWRSDGSREGTRQITTPQQPYGVEANVLLGLTGDRLFFSLEQFGAATQVWSLKTDFSESRLLHHALPLSSQRPALSGVGLERGLLFQEIHCCQPRNEVWVSDGTPAGTRLLSGNGWLIPFPVAGQALFVDDDTATLWKTDGTVAGTTQLYAPLGRRASGRPISSSGGGGRVYFGWTNGGVSEFMVSDGTSAGTGRLVELPGALELVAAHADGAYVLTIVPSPTERRAEIWHTDGTPAGTSAVYTYLKPYQDINPASLTLLGDRLFFTTQDAAHGDELWVSDGTRAGTTLCRDFNAGPQPSWPQLFGKTAGAEQRLVVSFWHAQYGRELWSLPAQAPCSHTSYLPALSR